MTDRAYTASQVARLAVLSRTYQEAYADIVVAVVQELKRDLDPEWRDDVAARFGLRTEDVIRYQAGSVKALHYGYIQRAGLAGAPHVYARILRDIESERLKPGDQLLPRREFTAEYYCNKRTHGVVVARLLRNGVVHRPGGSGGPLYIL